MATIKFGAIVTDMRGKLGGHVFQKGNQSMVMKTKTNPRVKVTETSKVTRGFVATVIKAYSSLSDAQKQAWDSTAKQFTFKNRFGDTVSYTGRQFYLYRQANNLKASFPIQNNLSLLSNEYITLTPNQLTLNTATQRFEASGSGSVSSTNVVLKIYISNRQVLAPNIRRFVYWTVVGGFVFNDAATYAQFVTKFGSPRLNSYVYCAYQLVNRSGFSTAPRILQIDVV